MDSMEFIQKGIYRPNRTINIPDGISGREQLPPHSSSFFFKNSEGSEHRVVIAEPKEGPVKAVMLTVPGIGQFAEELAPYIHDFNSVGAAVYYFAPHGQDLSDRDFPDPQLTTGRPVQNHAKHLNEFIEQFFIPHVRDHYPEATKIIVGMSHGGAIVNEYKTNFRHPFDQAVLAVMMAGVQELERNPIKNLAALYAKNLLDYSRERISKLREIWPNATLSPSSISADLRYRKIPTEFETKWLADRDNPEIDTAVKKWTLANEGFECNSLTAQTILNFARAARRFSSPKFYENDPNTNNIPTFIIQGGLDDVVSSKGLENAVRLIENSVHLIIPGMIHNGLRQDTSMTIDLFEAMRTKIVDICCKFSHGKITSSNWQESLEPELPDFGNTRALFEEGLLRQFRWSSSRFFSDTKTPTPATPATPPPTESAPPNFAPASV